MPQLPDELMKLIFPNGFEGTTRKNRSRTYGEFLCLEILKSINETDPDRWISAEDAFEIYQNVTKRKFYSLSRGSFNKYLQTLKNKEKIVGQKVSLPSSYSITKRYYYHISDISVPVAIDKEFCRDTEFTKLGKKLGIHHSQFEFNTKNGKFFLKE